MTEKAKMVQTLVVTLLPKILGKLDPKVVFILAAFAGYLADSLLGYFKDGTTFTWQYVLVGIVTGILTAAGKVAENVSEDDSSN